VAAAGVSEMLGAIDQTHLLRLLAAVAADSARAAIAVADEMQARSLSFDAALADLASLLLRIAMAQTVPDALGDDLPERAAIVDLAARIDAESVQLYYEIALQGREDLPLAPDEHAGFVMTLLRMLAFRPESGNRERIAPVVAKTETTPAADRSWPELARQLAVTGAARELARNAELRRREGSLFELAVPKEKAYLADRNYQDKLKAALEQHLGSGVTVKVAVGETSGASAAAIENGEREARRAEAARAVRSDGFVQDLVDLFDGKVVDSTIGSKQRGTQK
jgi:DNA polymerase-3 subunit gamma/tau